MNDTLTGLVEAKPVYWVTSRPVSSNNAVHKQTHRLSSKSWEVALERIQWW